MSHHQAQEMSKMFQEIEESVACGVTMAVAEMSDSQIKEMIMAPFKEINQEAAAV